MIPADHRLNIIFTLAVVAVIVVFNFGPIAQDPDYHRFADQRSRFGIANFYNVMSNLPFIIIGIMGMRLMARDGSANWLAGLKPLYFTFFAGVLLTGLGSSYYHFHPDNQTLLWDRLPMTIAIMAIFCAVVGEYVSVRWALRIAIPLLLAGLISVIYWYRTELAGHGDLRLYVLVQYLPIILIPAILWIFTPEVKINTAIWSLLAAYVAAKLAELYDAGLYGVLTVLSGHSLKHVCAAFGALIIYLSLRHRQGGLAGKR